MMFDHYKPYIGRHDLPNDFYPVLHEEIIEAETRLGFQFPGQLRTFYNEVGCGFYKIGTADGERDPTLVNGILSPKEIVSILLDLDSPIRPHEGIGPGLLPFFDCGENTYLVLKPQSAEPNAVFWPGGRILVSPSLEDFFIRLYEHADFYRLDYLDRHPALKEYQ